MKRIKIHLAVRMLVSTPIACATLLVAQAAIPGSASCAELTREQQEHFLLHAQIGKTRGIGIGVTGSERATLTDGNLAHNAHIQTVDVFMKKFAAGGKTELNFRDFYGFNVAGYRLDKLLGLNIVPVTVERRVRGERAAVGWWVDGVIMSGVEFRDRGFKAPPSARMKDQKDNAWVFQQLIYNADPNLGNVVIDQEWKGWIFDFTRSFRQWKKLDEPGSLKRIGRGFLERLRQLEAADVKRELGPYLKPGELKGLLARRDLMVRHFERLIAKKGELAVLIEGEAF